jgi:hypothetical protein
LIETGDYMKKFVWAAVVVVLLLPGTIAAQRRNPPQGERTSNISRVVADCEERTNQFRRSLRAALNRSALDGTRREDQLNLDAERLERAINRVRESWGKERDPARTRRSVSDAIVVGQDINRTMARRRLNPDVQRQWDVVRGELNRLAETFELPRIRW